MPTVNCPNCQTPRDVPEKRMGRIVSCDTCFVRFSAGKLRDVADDDRGVGGLILTGQIGAMVGAGVTMALGLWIGVAICGIILVVLQVAAVIWVASDASSRGKESAVWCLVVLLFPCVGLLAYLAGT